MSDVPAGRNRDESCKFHIRSDEQVNSLLGPRRLRLVVQDRNQSAGNMNDTSMKSNSRITRALCSSTRKYMLFKSERNGLVLYLHQS